MKNCKITIYLIFLPIALCFGQYWGEQVMEKSFEKSDIFFHSQDINPYGIQGFGNVLVGILDDPLILIQLNPANMADKSLKRHYFYTDFRNDKEIKDKPDYFYPWYDSRVSSSYMPYYHTYSNTRKAQEPIFSGAYLFRPYENEHQWTMGITYQMISQDEDYYSIPQDIYRSNIGYDYGGNMIAESASSIPVTDRYSGQDDMHQEAHILSFLSGIKLWHQMQFGMHVNRMTYVRDGGYGNLYNRDNNWSSTSASESRNWTSRDQEYDHWDVSAGLQWKSYQNNILGVTGGYIDGSTGQNLDRTYYYNYQYDNSKDYYSHYFSESKTSQTWDHQGNTYYGGLNITLNMDRKTKFKFYYKYLREDVALANASAILDTSYSEYHNTSSNWRSDSRYISALKDNRTGNGNRDANRHFITAAFEMKPGENTTVYFGIHFENHVMETWTREEVYATQFSDSWWKYDNEYNNGEESRYNATAELKSLHWDLSIQSFKVQIPVMIQYELNKTFEILFGLNRTFNRWKIEESTLAIFDYRDKTIDNSKDHKTNFGERYTEPDERKSDVSTAFLIGLIVKPAASFHIRLMAVPEYLKTWEGTKLSTFQWWIGFELKY